MSELTREQLDHLARRYFEEILQADEDQRFRARPSRTAYIEPQDGQCPIDADQELLAHVLSDVQEALAQNDFRGVQLQVADLLTGRRLHPDPKSETFRLLAHRVLRAQAEVLRMAYDRRAGDYAVEPRDPLFSWRPGIAAQPDEAKASLPLSQVVADFVAAKTRDGKWRPVTKRNNVSKLTLFAETLNDKPIDTVTRDDIRDWRDALVDLELAPNTIRLHFKVMAALFSWAKEERKATIDNPVRKLAPKGEEGTREAFQPEDLAKLFASPLYTGHWRPDRRERSGTCLVKDSKYWLPLIALHSGMRVEEIAKLRTGDVREIEGVWCFDVYQTKTEAGDRHVPVHPTLVELGLLDYVTAQRADRLWPEMQAGSEGKYSQRFCQWWAGFRHLIGLDRDGLVFHSFRHTFAAALERAGVQEAMAALLMGHRHPNITFGRYAGGKLVTPNDKLGVIRAIDFGVDLDHLLQAPSNRK
jgi:integrase